MNLVRIEFVDDEKLAECLNTSKHDIGLARSEHRVEVQVDSQRLGNRHTLRLVGGHSMGEDNRELDEVGCIGSSFLQLVGLKGLLVSCSYTSFPPVSSCSCKGAASSNSTTASARGTSPRCPTSRSSARR